MRELGINVEETAIMSAITPVIAMVMPPLAGMFADRVGNFKVIIFRKSWESLVIWHDRDFMNFLLDTIICVLVFRRSRCTFIAAGANRQDNRGIPWQGRHGSGLYREQWFAV